MRSDLSDDGETFIQVLLCCNDEKGRFKGEFEIVEVSDLITVEDSLWLGVKCDIGDDFLKVKDFTFPIFSHKRWIGSALWDSVLLRIEDVVKLLNYLAQGGWDCLEAEDSLLGKWGTIEVKYLQKALKDEK